MLLLAFRNAATAWRKKYEVIITSKPGIAKKPLSALLPLIQAFSRPGDLVLDPFAGSGSTLAAAHQLKRRFLGIEIDAAYHAIAEGRLHPLSAAGTGHNI